MTAMPEPTNAEVEAQHLDALAGMTPAQLLAVAREVLAAMIRRKGEERGVFVTRKESLDAVFEAEARAVASGAQPKVDFFVPLDQELPLRNL